MKKVLLAFIFSIPFFAQSALGSCNIVSYNSGLTCAQVQAALSAAIAQSEAQFKQLRRQNIEETTRTLSNKMEQYSKLTGVIYTINQAITTLRTNALFLREQIVHYGKKELEIEKVQSDSEKLEATIDILNAELKLLQDRK